MNRCVAVALATGFLFSSTLSFSQDTTSKKGTGTVTPGNFPGSGKTSSTGPKPYAEIVTSKAKTDRGLFTTHRVEDKYYFEIPDTMLSR